MPTNPDFVAEYGILPPKILDDDPIIVTDPSLFFEFKISQKTSERIPTESKLKLKDSFQSIDDTPCNNIRLAYSKIMFV